MNEYGGGQAPRADRPNGPKDPSPNVLDLVSAAIQRQDDLRSAENRFHDAGYNHLRDIATLRATHANELRELEANRIDAIRAVDVAASQQATKDAEVRASALAKQVSDSAEAMRNQVAAAATAAATSLGAALVPIQERLAELTRLQYEQQGQKAQVIESRATDADFAPVLAAIQRLESRSSAAQGRSAGIGMSANTLVAAVLVFATLAGLYATFHK